MTKTTSDVEWFSVACSMLSEFRVVTNRVVGDASQISLSLPSSREYCTCSWYTVGGKKKIIKQRINMKFSLNVNEITLFYDENMAKSI